MKKTLILSCILLCLTLTLCSGCGAKDTDLDPTGSYPKDEVQCACLMYNDTLYEYSGSKVTEVPEGFLEAGTIKKNVNTMLPLENLVSAHLAKGMKLFYREGDETKRLFVEVRPGEFRLFLPFRGDPESLKPN